MQDPEPKKTARPARRQRASLWRRMASGNAMIVLTICFAFGTLTGVAVYFVRGPEAFLPSRPVVEPPPGVRLLTLKAPALTAPVRLDPSDPAARFAETRVGHVLYATAKSDKCMRLLFDNSTGGYYEVAEISCGQTTDQAIQDEPAPMDVLKKSFQR